MRIVVALCLLAGSVLAVPSFADNRIFDAMASIASDAMDHESMDMTGETPCVDSAGNCLFAVGHCAVTTLPEISCHSAPVEKGRMSALFADDRLVVMYIDMDIPPPRA